MPENEKNNIHDQRIQNYFNQLAHIAIGQSVDFNFTDFNGVSGKVSDYKGKFVFIDFWATWCGPCLALLPDKERITAPHADKIKVITVSIDENIDRWKAKSAELSSSWVNIHYNQDIDLKKHFFIQGVPDNLLLSPDGAILLKKASFDDLNAILRAEQ